MHVPKPERNAEIFVRFQGGETLTALCAAYGLRKNRVYFILKREAKRTGVRLRRSITIPELLSSMSEEDFQKIAAGQMTIKGAIVGECRLGRRGPKIARHRLFTLLQHYTITEVMGLLCMPQHVFRDLLLSCRKAQRSAARRRLKLETELEQRRALAQVLVGLGAML